MSDAPDLEYLIARLRKRAADPDRRTDVPPSELGAAVRANIGLPEVGPERVVWGGLGWGEGDKTGGSSG